MRLKINELNEIRNGYPLQETFDTFLETGTHKGCTIKDMEPHFKLLHTIEITEYFYNMATKDYKGNKINFHLGDSTQVLYKILPTLKDKPTIFFLDAHWSCDKTGKGEKDVPLLEELEIINKEYNENCIVIIDDYRLFDGGDPYVNWSEITEKSVLNSVDDKKVLKYYAKNDRFILYLTKV